MKDTKNFTGGDNIVRVHNRMGYNHQQNGIEVEREMETRWERQRGYWTTTLDQNTLWEITHTQRSIS